MGNKIKNVLFYGDSNTWGFDPETRNRYAYDLRWTSVCSGLLGPEYHCVSAGMNGRMTAFDDPVKGCRNGLEGLDYELQTRKPLDLLVLMLGTNDLKYTDAEGSAKGMELLVEKAVTANQRFCLSSPVFPERTRILLISPVLVMQNINLNGKADAREESKKISGLYAAIADQYQLDFLDVSTVTPPSKTDGVHLDPEGHRKLGIAIAEKIRGIDL